MTSPYRQPPFESNSVGGPSRVGGVYDRVPPGTHAPYSHDHGYPDTVESPHNVNRRVDRTPSYYTSSPSAGYFASPHAENDSRQGRWNRDTTWYGSEPHSAASTTYTPRRPSPPPTHTVHPRTYESPTSQPTYPNYQEWRTSSPRTSAHWDERRTWEPARDERIHEHASWRHTRTESGSRLSTLLNPKEPSPPPDSRRWRSNEAPPEEQLQPRTFARAETSYSYEFRAPAPQSQPYYDTYNSRSRYAEADHRVSYVEGDRVRSRVPSYSDPAPRYPPPRTQPIAVARPSRPSALGDYKRQRHVSPPRQTRPLDVAPTSPSVWNRAQDRDWDWDRTRDAERERQRGFLERDIIAPRAAYSSPGQSYSQNYSFTHDAPRSISTASNPSRGPGGRDILNAAPVPQMSPPLLARPYAQRAYDLDRRSPSDNVSEDNGSDLASSRASDAGIQDDVPDQSQRRSDDRRVVDSTTRPYTPVHMLLNPNAVSTRSEEAVAQQESRAASVHSFGTPAGRSGVMSVHQLLTPTPERPSTARSLVTTVEGLLGPRVSPTPSAKSSVLDIRSLLTADEPPVRPQPAPVQTEMSRTIGTAALPDPQTVLVKSAAQQTVESAEIPVIASKGPPDEDMQLDQSIAATPISLLGTDVEAKGVTKPAAPAVVSPKPTKSVAAIPALPTPEPVLPRENVILKPPPRERPDAKMIADALKKVVLTRNQLDRQPREGRVNPILMSNLSYASPPPSRTPTSPETLVGEFQSKVVSVEDQESRMNTRAALAARFAEQRESLSEKQQRLRNEYIRHNRKWKAHCASLDASLKANVVEEAAATTGRTTRRSAATLGDAVRSDLEMEQIIASLGNEDMTDPNHLAVRNVATIPDMIAVEKGQVEYLFDDTNGLIDDPATFYDARSGFHDWAEDEKAIFLQKYAQFPKQFWHIASFLPNKTPSQCVLYYYVHKKRLIDFRSAVSAVSNRRRRGGRRAGKQKGNALLADIQENDKERPASGRRRRGGAAGEGRGGRRAAAQTEPAAGDEESRPRRRRGAATVAAAKTAAQAQKENEGTETPPVEATPEAAPPPKRAARKPRRAKATESPAPSQPPETRFIDVNETLGRRKPSGNTAHWSDTDKEDFLRLLAQHGRNFKRIASSMPNKTTVQVQNFFKNHMVEMDLDRIASSAQGRSQSPESSVNRDPFVNGSNAVTAPTSAAPTPPIEANSASVPAEDLAPPPTSATDDTNASSGSKSSKLPGPPGVGVMALNETRAVGEGRHIWMTEEFPFVHANTPGASRPVAPMLGAQPQVLNQKAYMSVLHPSSFQPSFHTPGSLRAGESIMSQLPTPIGWQTTQNLAQAHAQGQMAQGFRTPVPGGVVPIGPDKKHIAIQPAPIRPGPGPGPIGGYPFPIQPPHPQSPHMHPLAQSHPMTPHLAPRPGVSGHSRERSGSAPMDFMQGKGPEGGSKTTPDKSSPFTRNPLER